MDLADRLGGAEMISILLLAAALLTWPAGRFASARLQLATGAAQETEGESEPGRGTGRRAEPGAAVASGAEGHSAPLAARTLDSLERGIPALAGLADRLRPLVRRRGSRPVTADDAWAVELLAVAYAAGLDPAAALRAVASVVPGGAAAAFGTASAKAAMGQGVAEALGRVEVMSGVIPRVREALGRSESAGGSVVEALRRAAGQARDRAATGRRAAAERAGVLIAGPLGACFLPAFVCLGVAPVVLGLAGRILPEVFA